MPKERSLSPAGFKHRETALVDFQHQVKNLMATVRSVAKRTVETASDLESFAEHFDGRLGAMSRTFRMLVRTGTFDIDLEELIRDELLSQTAGDRASVEGPAVRLSQNAAEALGLAVHELAVNAVKFGALAGTGGHLAIHWKLGDDGLRLEWNESGVAAMDSQPKHRGFGREWIEQGLPYQLRARTSFEFLPGGVACTILIPGDQIEGGHR
jgi:two-component system CheB/CheR fusion protein